MPESLTERNHVYVLTVQNALFAFQMIEEALKIYIGGAYEIIKRTTPSPVAFSFDASAINNAPLGKLIKMFSGVSANSKLVDDLRKIEGWRNFCAHRAYTHEFMSRQSGTPVSAKDVDDVKTVTTFAVALAKQIGNDLLVLRETHRTVFGAENESDSEISSQETPPN